MGNVANLAADLACGAAEMADPTLVILTATGAGPVLGIAYLAGWLVHGVVLLVGAKLGLVDTIILCLRPIIAAFMVHSLPLGGRALGQTNFSC